MLTVYGRKTSSNVQSVMWCAAELGLSIDRRDYGGKFGGLDTPDFLALNPNRQIPVLVDGNGGPPLFESAAILRHLAGRYGDGVFWPQDLDARTQVDMWAEWAKTTACGRFTLPLFWGLVRTAPSKRDWPAITRALAVFEDTIAIAEARLAQHPYLVGDALTLADIQLGHILFRYFTMDLPERRPPPHLNAYYDRLCARPAYREHVMIDYSELTPPDDA